MVARLLVVFHSRSGGTQLLLDAALDGARWPSGSRHAIRRANRDRLS